MNWWKRYWVGVFVVLMVVVYLCGCTGFTLADIRKSHPDRTMSSAYPPKKIANCVAYEAPAKTGSFFSNCDSVIIYEQNGVYRLIVEAKGGVTSGELTIKPDNNGGSLIEYRTIYLIQGPIDEIWEYVKKCAGTPPAPGK